MKKLLGAVLVVCLFTSMTFASASVPVIVATASETTTGNYVIYVPAADGDYRASVYMESTGGSPFVCGSVSWTDDLNNTATSFCSDGTSHGFLVVPFHAISGHNIQLNADSFPSGGGKIYVVLEQL